MTEPILSKEDVHRWNLWKRVCLGHARTERHHTAVLRAEETILKMHESHPRAYVAWSGGKDSTALAHLAVTACRAPLMSIKDDLDFPGEEEYVRSLASQWGAGLDVLHPPMSLQDWLRDHLPDPSEDMHSRSSEFSHAAFYGVIDAYRQAKGTPGVYLGLRTEESAARNANRATRGLMYQKASSEAVCTPIADWSGMDVYAYLFANGIEPLPLYQCVRLHESPDRVRKSWWLPGAHSRKGGVVWLKTYYPSLYHKLVNLLPGADLWA